MTQSLAPDSLSPVIVKAQSPSHVNSLGGKTNAVVEMGFHESLVWYGRQKCGIMTYIYIYLYYIYSK